LRGVDTCVYVNRNLPKNFAAADDLTREFLIVSEQTVIKVPLDTTIGHIGSTVYGQSIARVPLAELKANEKTPNVHIRNN